jgi:predicted nucleic acid-binding protein
MGQAPFPTFITPLGELELINALHLRVFRREISPETARSATDLFTRDVQARVFALRALTLDIFERAKRIARKRTSSLGTRSLDVLHVASALVMHVDEFYSFDRNQMKLAKTEGLKMP